MVCFTKLTPRTPPSVIHGWKATDLLFQMVKRKNYCRNPISRQNFANALAENPNLKLEVCLNPGCFTLSVKNQSIVDQAGRCNVPWYRRGNPDSLVSHTTRQMPTKPRASPQFTVCVPLLSPNNHFRQVKGWCQHYNDTCRHLNQVLWMLFDIFEFFAFFSRCGYFIIK